MYFFAWVFIFIFGSLMGSFLNCFIYRIEKNKGFIKGRSYCPHCKHTLKWYDLIPVLSFILLKGRCRYCHKKISLQYPLVEIATGFLLILIFQLLEFQPMLFTGIKGFLNLSFLFIITYLLIIIFVYDLKHYIIPDKIIYPLIIIVFLYQISKIIDFDNWNLIGNWVLEIGNFILSAFFASLFFLVIVLLSKGKAMGVGDIKLAFFMGFFLGSPAILTGLFFAFLIGAIIGIGLILLKKKKLKSEIPFAPFLITGTLIAFFWSNEIIIWYLTIYENFYFPLL